MRRRDFLRLGTASVAASTVYRSVRGQASQPQNNASRSRFDQSTLDQIVRRIQEVMRERAVPGVSIAIVSGGRMVWQRAFGVKNASTKEPVDDRTVFEAA